MVTGITGKSPTGVLIVKVSLDYQTTPYNLISNMQTSIFPIQIAQTTLIETVITFVMVADELVKFRD